MFTISRGDIMPKKKIISILTYVTIPILLMPIVASDPAVCASMTDTVYVDDFERPDGPLGADWMADSLLVIKSGEVDNTDTISWFDDLGVYLPHTDPLGIALVWGDSAVAEGIDDAGLALMLSGPDTLANGYCLFKNESTNVYALRTIENGVMTNLVTNGSTDRFYPGAGDTFQIRIRSDESGHHFDVFYNHEYDATLTDPDKLFGNEPVLYSGLLMGGGFNNNVEEFIFVKFDDDSVAPAAITDLAASVRSDTSIAFTWTATGDDSTTGRAKSYELRYLFEPISEINWDMAVRIPGEPAPAPSGSADSLLLTSLQPDTLYYFAMKVSDGFPSANFSELSNVVSARTLDLTPPAAITDLQVVDVNRNRVKLGWHAPGDSDTLGIATQYDVRYSEEPITPSNFLQATQALGEPDPLPYDTYQEFIVPNLAFDVHYYFAMRTKDEANNWSRISNVVDTTTTSGPTTIALDDFERTVLGPWWTADPELGIADGELVNLSGEDRWDFTAIFNPSPNLEEVSYVWSESVDPEGTRKAGFVLMMDAADPDTNGYLLFRHDILDQISLWNVLDGVPLIQISSVPANLPDPMGGDEMKVIISQDESGNHFDFYLNGEFDNRVSDPDKTYGTNGDWYCGLMIHGQQNNNIEEFSASGPTAQIPPSPFFLLSPFDGDTVEVSDPLLDWMDALDFNPLDTIYYALYFGLSPVFNPDSTVVIDSLTVSEYQVPAASLLDLYRMGSRASLRPQPMPGELAKKGPKKVIDKKTDAARTGGSPKSPGILPDDVQIFWKVSSFDNTGLDTTWSINTDWSFFVSIPDAPDPFDLISPADGDTLKVEPLEAVLIWHAATDPDPLDTLIMYDLTYRKAGGDSITVEDLVDTTFTTPPLDDNSTYTWSVTAKDSKGLTRDTETWTFYTKIPSGIDNPDERGGDLPKVFALSQNYPNPFNPMTTIVFDIPKKAQGGVKVTLEIFSLRGLKVKTLVNNKLMEPGRHVIQWNGRDDRGNRVGSGIYIYKIEAGSFNSYRKMVMLK